MKILVLGAGNMGIGFVKQLAAAGHDISITARDAVKTTSLASQFINVKAVDTAGAAEGHDVVILATGYSDAVAALKSVGNLQGKTVIDISNPLSSDYMSLTVGHSTSAAEEIAKAIPGAKVVKAFNTVLAQVLNNGPKLADGSIVNVFYAGDDETAKTRVKSLAESIGFTTTDAGMLKNARYLEPLAGLNIYFAYGAGHGTTISPAWHGF